MGASTETAIKKDLTVCLKSNCELCAYGESSISECCPYAVLHILSKHPSGKVLEAPRRSGKTRKLTSIANQLFDKGFQIFYVTLNEDMARMIKRQWLNPKIRAFGRQTVKYRAIGLSSSFFVTDELSPQEAQEIAEECSWTLVSGYWTAH